MVSNYFFHDEDVTVEMTLHVPYLSFVRKNMYLYGGKKVICVLQVQRVGTELFHLIRSNKYEPPCKKRRIAAANNTLVSARKVESGKPLLSFPSDCTLYKQPFPKCVSIL